MLESTYAQSVCNLKVYSIVYSEVRLTIKEALKRARKARSDTCKSTRILSHRLQFNGSRGSEVG